MEPTTVVNYVLDKIVQLWTENGHCFAALHKSKGQTLQLIATSQKFLNKPKNELAPKILQFMMQSNPMAFSFIFCLSIIFDSE
jgi:ABC-type thiamine transport system substrate-binding protein